MNTYKVLKLSAGLLHNGRLTTQHDVHSGKVFHFGLAYDEAFDAEERGLRSESLSAILART